MQQSNYTCDLYQVICVHLLKACICVTVESQTKEEQLVMCQDMMTYTLIHTT